MGLDPKLVSEITGELRGGFFVSFDLAHVSRKAAQDAKGNLNALGKFLNATRQKLWRDLRQLGCPMITESHYYIPDGMPTQIPDGVKVHDNMTRKEAVESVFDNIAASFERHGLTHGRDSLVLIAPLITTKEKWEQMHASAMDNVLTFLQRKIAKLGELDNKGLEKSDNQSFSNTKNEVYDIMRMVENTKELRESAQFVDYTTSITLAEELINSVGSKIKRARATRGTVASN